MNHIFQLPTEIVQLISHHLVQAKLGFADNGLFSLRLTCRSLYLKTRYEFGRAAFSTLRLDLHPKTLKRLLDICKIPAYGDAVKKIVFAHWGDEYITFPDIESEERLEDQVLFVLKEIFESAFSGTPNLKEIVLVTPFIARFRRHPYTLDNASNHTQATTLDAENFCLPMSHLYVLVAQALTVSNVHISALETTRSLMALNAHLWSIGCISTQSLQSSAYALCGMRHLKISLNPNEMSHTDRDLCDALRGMPLLTQLDIRFQGRASIWLGGGDPGYEAPSGAALKGLRDLRFPRLNTLALRRARVEEDGLREFLLAHEKTLERVALCYVTLGQDMGWGSILLLMHDNLERLEELCVATAHNARRGPGTFDLVGRDAVMQHLGRILGRA